MVCARPAFPALPAVAFLLKTGHGVGVIGAGKLARKARRLELLSEMFGFRRQRFAAIGIGICTSRIFTGAGDLKGFMKRREVFDKD
jgi:hypothetical protein